MVTLDALTLLADDGLPFLVVQLVYHATLFPQICTEQSLAFRIACTDTYCLSIPGTSSQRMVMCPETEMYILCTLPEMPL